MLAESWYYHKHDRWSYNALLFLRFDTLLDHDEWMNGRTDGRTFRQRQRPRFVIRYEVDITAHVSIKLVQSSIEQKVVASQMFNISSRSKEDKRERVYFYSHKRTTFCSASLSVLSSARLYDASVVALTSLSVVTSRVRHVLHHLAPRF